MSNFTHPDLIDQKRFKVLVISRFPEFKESLENEDNLGLLHLEMASFRRFAQQHIDKGEFEGLKDIFDFLEGILDRIHPDVQNAIYVSFLENFDFEATENDRKARSLLPPKLTKMLKELDEL